MITRLHIETVLGAALYNLGYPVSNAALWKEELGENIPNESVIVAECERLLKEQKGIPTTMDSVRRKRDSLLQSSDWVGLTDAVVKNKEAWLTYRQALRDLPQNFSSPEEVFWPEPPK